jgi:hypothetical protein
MMPAHGRNGSVSGSERTLESNAFMVLDLGRGHIARLVGEAARRQELNMIL